MVENVVVTGEALVIAESHDSEGGGNGPPVRGQDRADQQHLDFAHVLAWNIGANGLSAGIIASAGCA